MIRNGFIELDNELFRRDFVVDQVATDDVSQGAGEFLRGQLVLTHLRQAFIDVVDSKLDGLTEHMDQLLSRSASIASMLLASCTSDRLMGIFPI